MKLEDLRGKSRADQFAVAAQYAGVGPEVFDGIWATESQRGNPKFMMSSAGAKGHFGIMPNTQATWEKRTGTKLDANDFTDSLFLSALTLAENKKHFGNTEDALRAYNGSWNRANWSNKETQAYVGKVLGRNPTEHRQEAPGGVALSLDELADLTGEELMDMVPGQAPRREKVPSVDDRVKASFQFPAAEQHERTTVVPDTQVYDTVEQEKFTKGFADSQSFGDKWKSALLDQSLTAAIFRSVARGNPDQEEGYGRWYSQNITDIEKFAENQDELDQLRNTGSKDQLQFTQADIIKRRGFKQSYMSGGSTDALIVQLAAGMSDPAGWLAGFGVGKGLQVAGVGGRALMLAGRPIAGAASMAAEGSLGNVAVTAGLQASGEHITSDSYGYAAGTGFLMGSALAPFSVRGVHSERLARYGQEMQQASAAIEAADAVQARTNLGVDAPQEAINSEMDRIKAVRHRDTIIKNLADIPEEHRFMVHSDEGEPLVHPDVAHDIHGRYDMAGIPDVTMRDMVTQVIARAEKMVADNPVDGTTKTLLDKFKFGGNRGLESTGMTMLADDSPTSKAVAMMLLEGTTGAGGRRRTAAISSHFRNRLYMEQVNGYEQWYHMYRKERGKHIALEAWDGKVKQEFDREVALEIERRNTAPGEARTAPPPHQYVGKAADLWERGMDLMRRDQQHVGTVGSARLGDSSVGYFRHMIDPRKLGRMASTPEGREQLKSIRGILSEQFQKNTYDKTEMVKGADGKSTAQTTEVFFDKKFSDELAAKYLHTALNKQKGSYPVPVNLYSPEAADIVRDTLEAMGKNHAEIENIMGKFSRGGASHTKQRLRINLDQDIGGGEKLISLFDTDVTGLYRSYSRRVAGEVALAQYGIMGKKGLDVLREAMAKDGASNGALEAFDQISAEFLNTPFGTANHNYMDNARLLTSMSRLGGMGITQFAEYGNAISALGAQRTFAAIKDIPRMAHEIGVLRKGGDAKNPILASIEPLLGGHIGLDQYHMQRIFDVKDNDIQMYGTHNIGIGTRAIRAGANVQAMISGHRAITAMQVRGLSEQIIHKAVKFARSGGEDASLRDMGINDVLQAKMKMDLPNIAEFDGRGNLTKLDLDAAKHMTLEDKMDLATAIERGASQIIQHTYIGETGKWAHNGFLKMLLQFRTFGVTAIEKQWDRNMGMGAAKAMGTLVGGMSFAIPIYMARMHLKTLGMSRSEREDFVSKNLKPWQIGKNTLNYVSAAGMAGDVLDFTMGFVAGWGGEDGKAFAGEVGARGAGKGDVLGGTVAPAVGLVEDVWAGAHGNGRRMMKAMPFANLPYLQPLINAFGDDED